jgi:tetratricopeptide (TPR) repeat protein
MTSDFDELREAGLAQMRAGDLADADRLFTAALACAPNEAAQTLINIYRAGIAVYRREASNLIDALPRNLMRRDSPRHVFVASYYLVMHYTLSRQPLEAARYTRTLLDAADELGDLYYSAAAYDSVSALEILRANYEDALQASVNALRCLAGYTGELDTAWLRGAAENNAGYCLLALNRHEEAIPYFQRSKHALAAVPGEVSAADVDVNLALAHLALGRLDEAEEHASRADTLITPARERLRRYVHYLKGEIAQQRGDPDAALQHFARLRTYYPEISALEDLLLMIDVSPLLLPEPE